MRVVRVPSKSAVKLDAVRRGLALVWPGETFRITPLPVELQDRPNLTVNAQPEGRDQTVAYAKARRAAMCDRHGMRGFDFDVSIESGAIDGSDVAVVVIYLANNLEIVETSSAVAFPPGTLDEARRRGFKTVTAGDIIHERYPAVPSNAWQGHPLLKLGSVSREDQITEAVMRGLQATKNR